MPALFLCIAVTCIFVLLIIPTDSALTTSSMRTGMASLFGLSNLYLLRQATDYFGSSAALNPFTYTWSLGVEEQFYFLFPFLLWFSGLPQKRNRGFRNFNLLIGVTAVTSLISYLWLSSVNPIVAFYLMPMRFWELALGAIASQALMKSRGTAGLSPKFALYITVAALVALIAVFFLPWQQSSQGFVTFTVVILTTILIFGIRPGSLVYKLLTLKSLVFLGVISYSLYLWHWSVLAISRLTVGVTFWTIPFQLTIIFLLTLLSYQFVEKPLRRSEWTMIRLSGFRMREIGHAVTLALGLASVMMVASLLHKQGYLYSGVSAPLIKKGVNTLKDDNTYKDYSWVANRCVLSANDEVGKVIRYEDCTFGDLLTAKRRFLIIGNSFSVAEIEMYKILVSEQRGSVTVTSSWGAPAVPEIESNPLWDKASNYYWESVVPTLTEQLSTGDVLLMINAGESFSPKNFNETSKQRMNDLQKGLMRISEEMLKRGIFVIYQSGIPFITESNCIPDAAMPQWWHFSNEPPCTYYTREESLERRRIFHDSLLSLQSKFKNFAVLDLFNLFCPSGLCRFYNDEGIFLYRDEWSHPSVEAAVLAQPLLLETVDKLVMTAKPPQHLN